jgi:hypothetical protein
MRPVFFVGVDTEADDQWSREGRVRLSVENAACLPRLQELCDRFGVRPSYMVTHEMATREQSAVVLRALHRAGRCEIAAHLHPWSSPPYREEDLGGRYPSELPDDLLARQLGELTDAIETAFGDRPTSYRAGRCGLDGRSLRILESLGYTVDTSVDPLFNEKRKGGPSFAGAPVAPYFPDDVDVRRPGRSQVLEIPISSATIPPLPKTLERGFASLPPLYGRAWLKRLGLRAVWLRPSFSTVDDAIRMADRFVAHGVPTLNLLFHSSELLPGGSPYHPDVASVERFFAKLERLLEYVTGALNVEALTYREFAARVTKNATPHRTR